jgi:pimeloyl-ACP methyl ester carboxylesterase
MTNRREFMQSLPAVGTAFAVGGHLVLDDTPARAQGAAAPVAGHFHPKGKAKAAEPWVSSVSSNCRISSASAAPAPHSLSTLLPSTRLEAAFRDWYAWTVNLPGPYFLETVEKLYKRNEIAAGTFEALGRPVDLKKIEAPLFLLAARYDELVTPPQLFAVERLVGTPPHDIRKLTADCRHLGLFMGKRILREMWPGIVNWLMEPRTIARNKPVDEMQPAA